MFPTATAAGRRFRTSSGWLAPTSNKKNTAMFLRRSPCGLVNRVQHFSGGITVTRPSNGNLSMLPQSRQLLSFPSIHCKGDVVSVARRTFASQIMTESEIKKRLDEFQELFVEARMSIEDVVESQGTKYFDEDAATAQTEVDRAVKAFEQLVMDIADPAEKNRVLRGNGLKVEQLKGELDLALKEGHDH